MEAIELAHDALEKVVEYYEKIGIVRKLGKRETELFEFAKEALAALRDKYFSDK